jgi:SAM-dependent methyltransferase
MIVRTVNKENEAYRNDWVEIQIQVMGGSDVGAKKCLDVGAGLSPYKNAIEKAGFIYFSHDFAKYDPAKIESQNIGLQNDTWDYPNHDYVCDVLDIPESNKFDLLVCTEVLEHVPDPVKVLEKLANLLAPGGSLLITAPLLSLIHQAPYYFSSGLSPFWYEYHADRLKLEVTHIEISGDFTDLLIQEIQRFLSQIPLLRGFSNLTKLVSQIKRFRRFIHHSISESGGFGVFVIMKNNGS